ncbi:unnamed protein product [Acanthocheilonema viteae]|uniref:V-type proton ATPase subunit S1/VOA1 transmembrane domain-containing protein n=1 Tax=Acanthocheilonema viteae TaxID=6277 RepID=A0A498S9D8_ACAVI|nr:unnamed protein product [Acanthocheilonema viteae]
MRSLIPTGTLTALITAFHIRGKPCGRIQWRRKMTIEDLTVSSKVLAIGIKDFLLPNFGIYAQAYSAENSDAPFASVMRIFPYQKTLSVDGPLMVTSNAGNDHKSAVGVDYTTFDSFKDLHDFLASNENFKDYQTIIISSPNTFKKELVRRKRVSSNVSFDDEPSSDEVPKASSRKRLSAANRHDMPVVLPAPNPSQKTTCLLYMEAFDIIIPNSRFITVGSEGKNKYLSEPDYFKCNVSSNQGGARLDFARSRNGYWYLDSTSLKNSFKITAMGDEHDLTISSGTATNPVDVGAVFNQNFACSQTDAAIFNASSGSYLTRVGIALRNFEVSLGLKGDKTQFGYHTLDCVGTFSAGSWMGIIISVVFISILLFGYLMVQSIHTMDRFDDLKQKQIVINFKE